MKPAFTEGKLSMSFQSFNQPAPLLGNQYTQDRWLQSYLRRMLPQALLTEVEPELFRMGELAGGELYQLQLADRLNEPRLIQWDAWGERIDVIELTPLWRRAEQIAVEFGLTAIPYESGRGPQARLIQFALVYLFHPSSDVYTCPLAMTDGAARTLLASGNEELIERALPHLTSRDPSQFWTSGQWMTESIGGSDVGQAETIACKGADGRWRLHGRKWFTSATSSQMALALARPEGNPPGGKGLALFYVETRDSQGRPNNIQINRLKEKLGTRKVPTAEISLDGVPAELVMGTSHGTRSILPMLHLTRTWNSITAVGFMRRGLALARDYARKRTAFGDLLAKKPLHADTLAGLQAELEGACHISFYLAGLIGRDEAELVPPDERGLLRLLTSLAKLTTGRQAVYVASEIVEAFGGAGYVEDTGLPMLLRDSQVLPIWEGTTNVLALDALKAILKGEGWDALNRRVRDGALRARDHRLVIAGKVSLDALEKAQTWLAGASAAGQAALEAGARRFALTLGRATELALMVEHAQWALDHEQDPRPRAAAMRFAASRVNLIEEVDPLESWMLADDAIE